jgi:hypothetical protein
MHEKKFGEFNGHINQGRTTINEDIINVKYRREDHQNK